MGDEREWWEERRPEDSPHPWNSVVANGWVEGYNAAVEAYKRSAATITSERARELSIRARNGDDEAAPELLRELSKT